MTTARQEEIRKEAVQAFNRASDAEFVSRYSSVTEVTESAYEILEGMPHLDVDDLTEEEYGFAAEALRSQLAGYEMWKSMNRS